MCCSITNPSSCLHSVRKYFLSRSCITRIVLREKNKIKPWWIAHLCQRRRDFETVLFACTLPLCCVFLFRTFHNTSNGDERHLQGPQGHLSDIQYVEGFTYEFRLAPVIIPCDGTCKFLILLEHLLLVVSSAAGI
jgi:hypothetical protein